MRLPLFYCLFLSFTVATPIASNPEDRDADADAQTRDGGNMVLRVCTTGDYPPLTSYSPTTGEFHGLIPTVLTTFGRSQNYTIEFVRSSWNTLASDLSNASQCLLAAGGITLQPNRHKYFGVSAPVLADRKVPVFSKENAGRFLQFTDIDSPEVTLLENLGADEVYGETLRQKGLLLKPLVRTVDSAAEAYACLTEHRDLPLVMFADLTEVDFHAAMAGSALSLAGADIEMPEHADEADLQVFLANNSTEGMSALFELNRFLTGAAATGLIGAWATAAKAAAYEVPHPRCPLNLPLV